ncbi:MULTISPECIES: nuclear transport factor 2 family protein [Nonomuraea]|jgi:uncharacterized protein (TIGR02246 family)|uniref:Nuclear transport factor 2 family protein n=2 Tax=Nonomuraea TaxID=83681 RepID=A0ABW1BLH6_9ACTN|nr:MULTISPECIES: nuclear transport factor 2 family protein [Nonomuraea]MDA0640875.1 nuclear transport factor 2 family protein [Nonomuraea ferruginea]TXK34608.1 nuclear transport factor 2 family protein [Nonomuraea sp. C10]
MSVDTAAIETINQEFYTAIEDADLDRMTEIWAEDGVDGKVSCVHPGWTLLAGRSEVLRSWALIMANTTYIQFVLTDVNTTVLRDDVAVLTCVENILTAGEEGESSFAAGKVVASNVYIRTPQGWRLWMHHGSPVLQSDDDEEEEGELEH